MIFNARLTEGLGILLMVAGFTQIDMWSSIDWKGLYCLFISMFGWILYSKAEKWGKLK